MAADNTDEKRGPRRADFQTGDTFWVQDAEYTVEGQIGHGGQGVVFAAQRRDGLKVSWVHKKKLIFVLDFDVWHCFTYFHNFSKFVREFLWKVQDHQTF